MFEIIKAHEGMLDSIMRIENESFTCPWSRKTFEDALSSKSIAFYAALSNGIVSGFYCIMIIENEAELLNLAVSASCRRMGYGSALMSHMTALAESGRADKIYLEVRKSNLPAQRLYRKFGFAELCVRRNYYTSPKEDAVIMLRENDLTEKEDSYVYLCR